MSMAQIEIRLPTALQSYAGGRSSVDVQADTVRAALAAIEVLHPGVGRRIRDEQGTVRRHVHVFHGAEIVRDLDAAVFDGDTLTVIAAVSGG
jgi:molybdopterin synthase sulfur carrier subunit